DEMSKKQTEAVLGDLVGLVTKHLRKGDRIRIGGLGILVVRKRAAREGRNPATGETIHIKASKKVAFRPAKELKEAVMYGPIFPGPAFSFASLELRRRRRTVGKRARRCLHQIHSIRARLPTR